LGPGRAGQKIVSFLDHQGFAVAVMQSNNDFTVGGSLSVYCHNSRPIASSVESFRLAAATGKIMTCSRPENPQLFSLVLGVMVSLVLYWGSDSELFRTNSIGPNAVE
jgi:hypothetical protein